MSLAQKVRLELEDGREIETTYDGRDLRAWETKHKRSSLSEPISINMLTWLGHHAAVRRGELNGEMTTYEAFDAACISVRGVPAEEEADGEVDPTPPKVSPKGRGAAPS